MSESGSTPFPRLHLDDGLVRDLRRLNPWWEGKAPPALPKTRRHLVGQIHRPLEARLAPIVAVRGPRQVGKTTAQMHVLTDLLARGVPGKNILRIAADELPALAKMEEPILRIADWYEQDVLGETLNEVAKRGEKTYLFVDEVQNLDAWAPQLKFLVDSSTTHVVLTGSSALRIEQGRDSLAGRITSIEAGVLSLTEIAVFRGIDLGEPWLADNGLEPVKRREFWTGLYAHGASRARERDEAFRAFSGFGGYPLAHGRREVGWSEIADQLNETVIRRVLRHDIGNGGEGNGAHALLFEEVFRLACRYVGECPTPALFGKEASRALGTDVSPAQVGRCLRALEDTLLLRLVPPFEARQKRASGGRKICLADHALRASWLQEVIPLDPEELLRDPSLTTSAGRIAESVVGATLATVANLDLAHLPPRRDAPEVDFVLTLGTTRIPLEVKYQRRIDPMRDTLGLRTFIEKAVNNAPFGLLVTQTDTDAVVDPRIHTIPLSTLMLLR